MTTRKMILVGVLGWIMTAAGCLETLTINTPITGKSYLGDPVSGAEVELTSGSGETYSLGTTDEQGLFGKWLDEISFDQDLLVTVKNGQIDETAFNGTLMACIPADQALDFVHVNILSTLIVRYMQVHDTSYDEARSKVLAFLDLAEQELRADSTLSLSETVFSAAEFLVTADANGGFDAYVTVLVTTQIPAGGTRVFAAANGGKSFLGKIASAAVNGTLKGLKKKVVSGVLDTTIGWVCSLFGFDISKKDPLEDIKMTIDDMKDQLTAMSESLDGILDQVAGISEQLDALMAEVNLTRDAVIADNEAMSVKDAEDIINGQYANYLYLFSPDSEKCFTTTGEAQATDFADNVLSVAAYNIDLQIYHIYSGMVGNVPGSTGVLQSCTNLLIDRVNAGEDLTSAYLTLEAYTGELMSVQSKGVILVCEAMHHRNDDLESDDPEAESPMDEYLNYIFQSYLDAELAVFSKCVDQLVLSQMADESTLPDDAETIYNRADFFMAQLSDDHSYGLNMRLVGPVDSLQSWLDSGKITVRVPGESEQAMVTVLIGEKEINTYGTVGVVKLATPGLDKSVPAPTGYWSIHLPDGSAKSALVDYYDADFVNVDSCKDQDGNLIDGVTTYGHITLQP